MDNDDAQTNSISDGNLTPGSLNPEQDYANKEQDTLGARPETREETQKITPQSQPKPEPQPQKEKIDMQKYSTLLPKEMVKKIKMAAIQKESKDYEIVIKALEEYLR